MALLKAASADDFIPTDWLNAAKFFEMTYTGGARNNQQGLTTVAFITVVAGANQSVTFDARDRARMTVGAKVQISDGTDKINGTVLSVSGNVAVVRTDTDVSSTAGASMGVGATITPITTVAATLVAVGASLVITLASEDQAKLFQVGDTVAATDGTDSMTGTVASRSGANLTLTTTIVSTAGNTLDAAALVTSTTGDRIAFGKIPTNTVLDDAYAIMSATNASVTVSMGWTATDESAESHQADLIAAGTALATATRIRANSTVMPVKTTEESYLTMTIAGGPVTAATVLSVGLQSHFPGNP